MSKIGRVKTYIILRRVGDSNALARARNITLLAGVNALDDGGLLRAQRGRGRASGGLGVRSESEEASKDERCETHFGSRSVLLLSVGIRY